MTKLTAWIANWLGGTAGTLDVSQQELRPFRPNKDLCETDQILVDMLSSVGDEGGVCYCVCDPEETDCPIIYASAGFCRYTGYLSEEIQGRNCRFLQGTGTSPTDVEVIRQAIHGYMHLHRTEPVSVNLLNYRKDGSSFCNEFFLAPLRSSNANQTKLQYLIGVQCPVSKLGPGQAPKNTGYVQFDIEVRRER